MLYIFQIVPQRYCFSAYYHIDKYRQMTLYNKKTAAHPMCNPYVSYTNKFKLQVLVSFGSTIGTSLRHLWAFCGLLQVLCRLRDHFATTIAHLSPKCVLFVGKIQFPVFHISPSLLAPHYYRTKTRL